MIFCTCEDHFYFLYKKLKKNINDPFPNINIINVKNMKNPVINMTL